MVYFQFLVFCFELIELVFHLCIVFLLFDGIFLQFLYLLLFFGWFRLQELFQLLAFGFVAEDIRTGTFRIRLAELTIFLSVPAPILLPWNNFYNINFKKHNKLITHFSTIIWVFPRLMTNWCSHLFPLPQITFLFFFRILSFSTVNLPVSLLFRPITHSKS